MALKATIFKANLQINDLDRHYYALHPLILAQHPSETNERLMVRLLAFALEASETLEFGKGLSSEEPALWQHDATGLIERIIEVGLPEEALLRRYAGRATEVMVYAYGGRTVGLWWEKLRVPLGRLKNLRVVEISPETSEGLGAIASRTMNLQCLISDGEAQIMTDTDAVTVVTTVLQ
jgi:uncharacterized protein YaeQ